MAFTRAKTKLLVVGSKETLKGHGNGDEEMVAKFVKLMEEKEWVFDLPKNALEDHLFDSHVSQTQASALGSMPPPPPVFSPGKRRGIIKINEDEKENSPSKEKWKVIHEDDIDDQFMEEGVHLTPHKGKPVLGESRLNVTSPKKRIRKSGGGGFAITEKRQPKKTVVGQKPFKPPQRMSVLGDIMKEALG